MRTSRFLVPAVAALHLTSALQAEARPGWITGTFVYANLCTDRGSGGLAGRRVVVHRSPNGSDVTIQTASGTLGSPKPVETLSIDDARQEISFTVTDENGPIRFQGIAASTELAGTISDGSGAHPLRLRRVLRSRAHEVCGTAEPDPDTTASTN